jgi:hypothetical protein
MFIDAAAAAEQRDEVTPFYWSSSIDRPSGATSFRMETHLPPSDGTNGVKPVTLRPGL